MAQYVRVFCPTCHGESQDPSQPACEDCMCGGHLDINRNPDGSVPETHPDGRAVVEWVDRLLPELTR
jgi:DnaJ-class molecular chaperone